MFLYALISISTNKCLKLFGQKFKPTIMLLSDRVSSKINLKKESLTQNYPKI